MIFERSVAICLLGLLAVGCLILGAFEMGIFSFIAQLFLVGLGDRT